MGESDEYNAGYVAATVKALQEGQVRIEKALDDHRKEERATWDGFEQKIQALQNWKAWAIGFAGGISLIVSFVWHFLTRR